MFLPFVSARMRLPFRGARGFDAPGHFSVEKTNLMEAIAYWMRPGRRAQRFCDSPALPWGHTERKQVLDSARCTYPGIRPGVYSGAHLMRYDLSGERNKLHGIQTLPYDAAETNIGVLISDPPARFWTDHIRCGVARFR